MKVGITGTPGTGKTTVTEALDREIIDMKKFACEKGLGEQTDLLEIDVSAVNEELPEKYWIEGHLAHKMDLDYCIVLRTRPDILRDRLEARDYSEEKINENVEAEAMDLILSEASQKNILIYEIDTTEKSVDEVVNEIESAVENKKEKILSTDWTKFLY